MQPLRQQYINEAFRQQYTNTAFMGSYTQHSLHRQQHTNEPSAKGVDAPLRCAVCPSRVAKILPNKHPMHPDAHTHMPVTSAT
jgi:hypothetical protein